MSTISKLKIKTPSGVFLPITEQVRDTILADYESDPVYAQYYPSREESLIDSNETDDPIGDYTHTKIAGLVHRYKDRVLLKITDTCEVYCRFCFRKEMVGQGKGILTKEEFEETIDYIKTHTDIREVILSGGDPLTLSNRRLRDVLVALNSIEHIEYIRFHTRAPIVRPERIDADFIDIINSSHKPIYIVFHVNHAQEINEKVISMFDRMSLSRATLLSQTVLLKKINDNVESLQILFTTLVKNHVKPYYLHHPDLTVGTKHFRVSLKTGQNLMKQLRKEISSLCIPNYVIDIPGGHGKIPINSCYINERQQNIYELQDHQGNVHIYEESIT